MLPDIERKLLRILYNYSAGRRRLPTMKELEIKTGRRTEDIKAGLLALEKDNYILWENKLDTRHIVIIEGWDRDPKISTPTTPPGAVNRYYTEY
ncbi:hypothetical protein G9G53_22795 [Paenibacillus sp. EKM206P]|uniref:hypothetical protein n=1 Tax=Paenibacillus sp. EKM206P TaxID=1683674 RepID=UPI0013ED351C|nr:hypothetical protein [Paenibacillus sp. EKM206P]KAF6569119.1 hypothetical protein G9G53_22795 [Paenibacillus sp. EKM206P]